MTCVWMVSNTRFSERYPLIITETCVHTYFMMTFGKNGPFPAIFRQFLDNQPIFMENLPKKGPLFREFRPKKPIHMGGTYPYPQHVMYPPPRVLQFNVIYKGKQDYSVVALSQSARLLLKSYDQSQRL